RRGFGSRSRVGALATATEEKWQKNAENHSEEPENIRVAGAESAKPRCRRGLGLRRLSPGHPVDRKEWRRQESLRAILHDGIRQSPVSALLLSLKGWQGSSAARPLLLSGDCAPSLATAG